MAQYEEVIKVSTETKGTESVKSIREELKKAKQEAIEMARKFGDFDERAVKAAKKVANLQDEIGDLNQRIAGLNPDKFQAIAGVVQGIAGGVAAAQGAMALFGVESEDTAKTLAKVQGAIAFSQGIQQILDLRNSFGAMASVLKTQVIGAFTTLKGAIAATGIGALVVGIGLLIAKLDELADEAEKTAQRVEDSFAFIDKVRKKDELDRDLEIARAKERGASEQELFTIREKYARRHYDDLISAREQNKGQEERFDAAILEAAKQHEIQVLDFRIQQSEKARQAAQEAYAKRLQDQKEFLEKLSQMEKDLTAQKNTAAKGFISSALQDEIDGRDRKQELEDTFERERLDRLIKRNNEEIALNEANRKKELENQNRIIQAKKAAEVEAFQNTSALLGAASQLFGQTSKAGKAFALAQIGADTARALSGALANSQSPTPDNVATGGLAGIAKYIGLAAMIVQNIARAKQILGASGGGGSTAQANSPSSFNPITSGSLPSSDVQAGQFSGMGRVYVLEGDITKSQGRVRNNKAVSVL